MNLPVLSLSLSNFNPTPRILFNTSNFFKSPEILLNNNKIYKIKCCSENSIDVNRTLKTCKNCKTQFDPALNNPLACGFHTAHFAGETKRKFESVHSGGTMNTPNSGQVLEYWHCCGSEDPFGPGCTSSPHLSYDD